MAYGFRNNFFISCLGFTCKTPKKEITIKLKEYIIMGSWGTILYANDTTSDIKDFYMTLLRNETSNEEALKLTLEQFDDLIGDEEEPLLWFALSETMWQVGRMTPEIKSKVLEWLDKDGYMEAWEANSKSMDGWRKTIDKLKIKIESPMRSEKKIKKPTMPKQDLWNLGDVYAYKLHKEDSKKMELKENI